MSSTSIESVLSETRSFPPPAAFSKDARVKSLAEYEALYEHAARDPEGFWAEVASELAWVTPWQKVLEWDEPDAKWFIGGKLNASVSCLDRHAASWRRNKAAIIFEGEPGDSRVLTYGELHREVCKAANALTELGVRAGDFVAIYLPMIPEAAIAMLACARIGAPHTVVFG
ncbi:MAG: acetyl-coenzyme A synthetase N-terminal domain-containing protein, partial [Kofleriaceae bacterium]